MSVFASSSVPVAGQRLEETDRFCLWVWPVIVVVALATFAAAALNSNEPISDWFLALINSR